MLFFHTLGKLYNTPFVQPGSTKGSVENSFGGRKFPAGMPASLSAAYP